MSLRPQATQSRPVARPKYSSRSTYPAFVPLKDTIFVHLSWTYRGLLEALRWDLVFTTVAADSEIRSNILKSFMLNALSLVSIYAFDLFLHPLVRGQQNWLNRNLGWIYQALWLMPLVGVSFYLNSSWCSIIANRTFALQHGNRIQPQPVTYSSFITALATSAYRVIMILTSVVLSFALNGLPVVGPFVGFLFACWFDSYYFFEPTWMARTYALSWRVGYLEERWAYFLGFGLVPAALCTFGSGFANAALFALVYPAYVIMAVHSHPLPHNPYNPLPPAADSTMRHPSPFVPIRLPIFAIVIWLDNWIVRVLGAGDRRRSVRGGSGSVGGRGSVFGDGVESVEEGERVELPTLSQATWRDAKPGGRIAPALSGSRKVRRD